MIDSMKDVVRAMVGLKCSRREVGRSRSLSLGFGPPSKPSLQLNERLYREWEIGTYRSAWRVVRGGVVICGSQDAVDSIGDLDQALQKIELGRFFSLHMVGNLDVRVEFDNDTAVDFLATMSDEDEVVHLFCADRRVAVFSVRRGWEIGAADRPWTDD
jgi:hypothetical protein